MKYILNWASKLLTLVQWLNNCNFNSHISFKEPISSSLFITVWTSINFSKLKRKPLGCVFLVDIWCSVVMRYWKYGIWPKILKYSQQLKLGKDVGSTKLSVSYGGTMFLVSMKSVMTRTNVLKWNKSQQNILIKRLLLQVTHQTSKNML